MLLFLIYVRRSIGVNSLVYIEKNQISISLFFSCTALQFDGLNCRAPFL